MAAGRKLRHRQLGRQIRGPGGLPIERKADGLFFVVKINRQGGDAITTPDRGLKIHGGDGVVIVSRNGEASRAMFEAPAEKIRAGRATF